MSNKLEIILRKLGRELADYQVARFFKVPEEMQQTPCDFAGYTAKGRAIIIEAKMVKGTSLPIGKKPGLLPHQWSELCDAHRAGAIALLVWANVMRVAVLDVPTIYALSEGKKSISWMDVVSLKPCHLFSELSMFHWLEPWLPIKAIDDGRSDLLDIITN